MARLDHAAIFVLIAGSFTAIHGILFRGVGRWVPLVLFWLLASAAISLKTVFFNDLSEPLTLSLYLALGWIGLISGSILGVWYGWRFIRPLVEGGVAYTVGAVLDFLRWPVLIPGVLGPHELFHVAVLAGAGFQWWFIWGIASGKVPPRRVPREMQV
jgi:channel protein (hemolysin III family)